MFQFLTESTATISVRSTLLANGGSSVGHTSTPIIIATTCFLAALVVTVIAMTVLVVYRKKCVHQLPGGAGDDRKLTAKGGHVYYT